jgi:putative ABC transport system ATP-binding protein
MKIEQGEFAVITGDEGSGKTTLLRLLGGNVHPTNGMVYYKKENVYTRSENELAYLFRNDFGFISEDYKLISGLSVYDNIILPVLLNKKSPDRNYLLELTDELHLTKILNRYPKHITQEERYCTIIARALINQPEIIFADDPTKNLDIRLKKDVLDLLMNYTSWHHRTLVISTCDQEVSIFADHIIRLELGRKVADQKIRKLRSVR